MAKMCTNQDLNYAFNLELGSLTQCPTKYQAQSQSSYKISVDSAYEDNQLFPIDAATLVSTGLKLRVILNTNFIESDYHSYWYYNNITRYGIYGRWMVASDYSDYMVQVFGNESQLEVGREYTYESDVRIPNPYGTGPGHVFSDIGIDEFAIWFGNSVGQASNNTWECRLEIQYYQYESAIGSGWSALSGSNDYGTSDTFIQYSEYLNSEGEIQTPSDKYSYWVPINGQGYQADDNGIFELQIKPIRTYTS